MATFKTDAVKSGIMPDDLRAGMVLCRVGTYTIPSSSKPAVGDTIQMVPVPKNAKILNIHLTTDGVGGSSCKVDIGDGGDTDRYDNSVVVKSAAHVDCKEDDNQLCTTYSADDTIDLVIASAAPATASKKLEMMVFYTMEGTISDQDTSASSKIP